MAHASRWLSSTSVLLLSACLQQPMNTSPGDSDLNLPQAAIDWSVSNPELYSAGKGEATSSSFGFSDTLFCFENSYLGANCRGATSSVKSVIGNDPVAIRGFMLNFYKNPYDNNSQAYAANGVVIQGAWVETAELSFDLSDGSLRLSNHEQTVVHAGACDLDDVNNTADQFTVGYREENRILTGLYLADEYDYENSIYTNAHIRGARVSYSAIEANPEAENENSTCGAYCWTFLPNTDAGLSADFGQGFVSTTSPTVLVSNYFGVTASTNIDNWQKRVITGFCLAGYKQYSGGAKRPLVHHMRVRTHQPVIVRVN
ncbi:MAG TPA: hypothetical protein VM901_09610 [Bdellovibrionota bacterium]|nr:hypothetical protein [Bdellovibrionota bacterium]